ncbi:MAG: AAA family ATPase [Candidatus Omnitrophica bacterium]|nr:AAA family ATPase [Candidatus Omnitrophota bacterium]MBU0878670.1 AAA family ATPase [Candidatus Omnitrophota bacterium]MBU0896710.1 AAA family ATPase [Candidatus Omnitrophota bacterium]MBU1134090.1 AAA family ATPase [Candidatus Omnitrophota bacterium]MBU1367366.1 AAA family ATPase [Candidatus Omnitrophota bacterium]
MKKLTRILNLKLPRNQSAFLWGARKTGKTTYLKDKFPSSLIYDFLKTDLFLEVSKNPAILRQRILAQDNSVLQEPIILDEVQKVPQALDEVHWLIENKGLRFVLCGSSARKLKRGHVNLLGGRAWRFELFPLVSREIGKIDLLRVLNHGLIPQHYLQNNQDCQKSLQAYVQDYLREEVFAEGLTRNIPAFSRFFDAFGYTHAELTNYVNIARECGVDSKTVKEYYQILIDTLLAIRVEPFKKRQSRQVITKASKYYMFDVGVAGCLTKRKIIEQRGVEFGKAFEHFILMEIVAYRSYSGKDFAIHFWRTKTGLEVDFVLGLGEVAIEVKGTSRVDKKDTRGLEAFRQTYFPKKNIIVCNEKEKRIFNNIDILPWEVFLNRLWAGRVI